MQTNEVKNIMIDNIEKIILRGDKLDDLVEKTSKLTTTSKMFYKKARELNRCCNLL